MKLNKLMTTKGVAFLILFSALAFFGERYNFSKLIGAENQFFTLFQFFGPIAGAFLGPTVGVLAVLIAEIASFFYLGKVWSAVNLLRLLPMLFAAWYFGTRKKDTISITIPLIAIALFIAHPIGRQAWFFSLFWTIPILVKMLPVQLGSNPFMKGLGATFTAHAVGGAMWNYLPEVSMTPAAWVALIPVVIKERLLFAAGIGITFFLINTLLDRLDAKTKSEYVFVQPKYVLAKKTA